MRLTIGKKVFGGFGIVLLLLIVVNTMSVVQVRQVDEAYSRLLDEEVHKVNLIKDMMSELQKAQINANGYLLRSNNAVYVAYKNSLEKFEQLYTQLEKLEFDEEARGYVLTLNELVKRYNETTEKMFALNRSASLASVIDPVNREINEIMELITDNSAKIIQIGDDGMSAVRAETERTVGVGRTLIMIIGISALILGVISAFFIGQMIPDQF